MKKTLLIYNSPILIEIFREIKDNLDFNFLTYTEDTINNLDLTDKNNYIIIAQTSNKIKNAKVFNVPIKIKILLEKINIWFLAKNFSSQSNVEISNYCLDLNSRKISRNEKFLYLTEKEVQLIMFIETNSVVRLKDIQKEVWNYSLNLETHTVETHIYRLRKKFLKIFNDDKFIKYNKSGYFINEKFKS